jgi:hypothetical protein
MTFVDIGFQRARTSLLPLTTRTSTAPSTSVIGEVGNQQTSNLPTSEGSRVIAFNIGHAET